MAAHSATVIPGQFPSCVEQRRIKKYSTHTQGCGPEIPIQANATLRHHPALAPEVGSQMQVHASPIMPARSCKYCLALQEGSVFADFDADENGQLYLVRISFDGYGCCHPSWDKTPVKIPPGESRQLARRIESGDLAHPDVGHILNSYFVDCGEAIWVDALEEHGLI